MEGEKREADKEEGKGEEETLKDLIKPVKWFGEGRYLYVTQFDHPGTW